MVAAGHETDPGNLTRIGGTPEETHSYLGSPLLSETTPGIVTNQSLLFWAAEVRVRRQGWR